MAERIPIASTERIPFIARPTGPALDLPQVVPGGPLRGKTLPGLLEIQQGHLDARLAEIDKDMLQIQATVLPLSKIQLAKCSAIGFKNYELAMMP